LQRQFFGAADPTDSDAEEIPGFRQTRPQGRGLRSSQGGVNTSTLETEGKSK
jgi:hypothetical protein